MRYFKNIKFTSIVVNVGGKVKCLPSRHEIAVENGSVNEERFRIAGLIEIFKGVSKLGDLNKIEKVVITEVKEEKNISQEITQEETDNITDIAINDDIVNMDSVDDVTDLSQERKRKRTKVLKILKRKET